MSGCYALKCSFRAFSSVFDLFYALIQFLQTSLHCVCSFGTCTQRHFSRKWRNKSILKFKKIFSSLTLTLDRPTSFVYQSLRSRIEKLEKSQKLTNYAKCITTKSIFSFSKHVREDSGKKVVRNCQLLIAVFEPNSPQRL